MKWFTSWKHRRDHTIKHPMAGKVVQLRNTHGIPEYVRRNETARKPTTTRIQFNSFNSLISCIPLSMYAVFIWRCMVVLINGALCCECMKSAARTKYRNNVIYQPYQHFIIPSTYLVVFHTAGHIIRSIIHCAIRQLTFSFEIVQIYAEIQIWNFLWDESSRNL